MTEYAIETSNLKKSYGSFPALKGIDLHIPKGSFYGLLGPNGAGKTTTIGILTGLIRLTSGGARIFGKDVLRDFRFTRKSVGLSPQELNFDPFFKLHDLLTLQAGYYGYRKKAAQVRAMEMLEQFGLTAKADAKMRELSGGMKRRVQIAKALVHDPPVVILDEPTAGVDLELRLMLWEYLNRVNKQGKTILLTTHYIEEAEQLCDTVAIIDEGRIVAEGSPEKLIGELGKTHVGLKIQNGSAEIRLPEYQFTHADGHLVVPSDDPERDLPRIISALMKQDVIVEEAKICRSTLEDVFIQLTGKTIDD